MDVFKTIKDSLSRYPGEKFHLHQGKLYDNPSPRRDFAGQIPFLIEPQVHSDENGEAALRELIATIFLGSPPAAAEIALCNGGTNALALTFKTLLKPNRPQIQVLSPYWMYLPGVVGSADGQLHEINTLENGSLKSAEQILSEIRQSGEPSLIYLANPANPVGNIWPEDFLTQLIQWCETSGAHVVVDHAYYGFTDRDSGDGLIPRLPDVYRHPRVVNAFTFSKLLGLPGQRLGFIHAAPDLIRDMAALYRNTNYCPNSYAQSVVYEYLKNSAYFRGRREKYRENLEIYNSVIGKAGPRPEGGFFSFIPLPPGISTDEIARHGIGVVDGTLFGADCNRWARICFTAEPPAKLAHGLKKLKTILEMKNDY
jgi:aspartate aminotransferase